MAIYLLRHGETDANAARVVQLPDVPLSARGREQAARLARRLAGAGVAHVVSSDVRRALETAEALRDAAGVSMTVDPDLAERNYGDVRGTPYAELGVTSSRPTTSRPAARPGPNSMPASTRCGPACWLSRRAPPGDLAVVTHGLVCEAVLQRHLRRDPRAGVPALDQHVGDRDRAAADRAAPGLRRAPGRPGRRGRHRRRLIAAALATAPRRRQS